MLDVEIRNFQSIEHVHLRIDGFTALVGRSNIGKSAIVRAVKAALTGAPEDNYVRHGASCEKVAKGAKSCKCYCSVHLKAEGFDLLWEKGGDKNEYVFNGEKKTAVARGTPEFLEDSFGLVKVGDTKILLQVADQFRSEGGGPIFLLDEYGGVVADVLSDVAQLDRINVATKMAEKDRRDCVSQRKVREKDVLDLKLKVTSYDGLDEVLAHVKEVEEDERKVEAKKAKRDQLVRFKEDILTVGRQIKALMGVPALVVPEVDPLKTQSDRAAKLTVFLAAVETRQVVINRLAGVDTIQAPDIETVHSAEARFRKLYTWLTKVRTYKELFANWKGVEAAPTPDIAPITSTSAKSLRLATLRKQLTALETQTSTLEKQLEEAEAEFQAVKAEEADLGVCPTCAQPVTLAHEHAAE